MRWADALKALVGRAPQGSAARRLIALERLGQPVWSRRRYDAFADEGYRRNVIAFRAVSEVSQAAASVPWVLFRRGRDGRRRALDEHPLLALLRRPNPLQSGAALLEAIHAYRLIAGNAFVEAVAPDGRPPIELYALRPDRMQIIPGASGLPAAYRYVIGERSRDFPVDALTGRSAILHVKAFHPLDDWLGLSPLEAAAYAIDQHNAAGAWNQALLQNGARPSGALMVGGGEAGAGPLTDEQFERLKSQIDELYAGPRNAGRPVLLEGGLTWQEMSLSPKDMDFTNVKHTAARDIALAFGVPPQLLGIPGDNTYANMREARLALWEETVLPLVDQVRGEFDCWLAPRFGDDLALGVDLDRVPALALRRERVWEKLAAADFLTVNEKRAATGYGARPEGDVLARASQDDDAPARG